MNHLALISVLSAVALLSGLIGCALLFKKEVFTIWLKGMFGFSLIVFALSFVGFSVGMVDYRELERSGTVFTTGFEKTADGFFDVTLSSFNGDDQTVSLEGETWSLQLHVLEWASFMHAMRITDSYRAVTFISRTMPSDAQVAEEEPTRQTFVFESSGLGLDLWSLADQLSWNPFVTARSEVTTYSPMLDGAEYTVSYDRATKSFSVRPINDAADEALGGYQLEADVNEQAVPRANTTD